jgi:hypothetical protein
VSRIIVAGATGFFGRLVVRILRAEGVVPLTASRRKGCDLMLDVEDSESIRETVRPKDVIVDATAPFQTRTTTLLDGAIAIGADVADLSDSFEYARLAWTRDDDARRGGVRVLNSCSSVSVLSALAIEHCGIRGPIAVHGFLAPASRRTAGPGVAASLLASVGRPITVRREGEFQRMRGWMNTRTFAALRKRGWLMEMADAFTLPQAYPSLRHVDFWVNPNTPGVGPLLGCVARLPFLVPIAGWLAPFGARFAKMFGSDDGVLAYEVEGVTGESRTIVFTGRESFLMAAIPAALAAMRLASGEPYPPGVVPVHAQVPKDALVAALTRYGICIS